MLLCFIKTYSTDYLNYVFYVISLKEMGYRIRFKNCLWLRKEIIVTSKIRYLTETNTLSDCSILKNVVKCKCKIKKIKYIIFSHTLNFLSCYQMTEDFVFTHLFFMLSKPESKKVL